LITVSLFGIGLPFTPEFIVLEYNAVQTSN